MPLPQTTGGYVLGPDEGEALWFNGGLGLLKATADQTAGRFAAMELRARLALRAAEMPHLACEPPRWHGQFASFRSAGPEAFVRVQAYGAVYAMKDLDTLLWEAPECHRTYGGVH